MSTEIPIWVNGKIRWLSGIDKKTTCKDVVEVLLNGEGMNKSEAKDFAIMERWRKVERPLDENSKILRIWSHWGNEKKEVRLCLRRIDNEVDSGRGSPILGGNISSARRKRNRHRGNAKPPWVYKETLHPRRLAELERFTKKDYEEYQHVRNKQSEVNEDCEPLADAHVYPGKHCYYEDIYDKIHDAENNRKKSGHKSYHCSGTGRIHSTPLSNAENHPKRTKCCSKRESKQKIRNSENIEKLMKLILAQGATIQSQLQKLKEREEQIESLEHERHRERIEKNGRNYLLETYLGSLKEAEVPEDADEAKLDEEGEKDQTNFPTKKEIEERKLGLEKSGKIYGRTQSKLGHRREGSNHSSVENSHYKYHHKGGRSRSESRNQESNSEGNLKRTLSDNAIAETGSAAPSDCSKQEDSSTEPGEAHDAKEEFQEVAELRRIQSQIEMWEKVFKINKKLEKEEENLVRLHIKIKKFQSENYRIAKVGQENENVEATDSSDVNPERGTTDQDPEEMHYEQDCVEMKKNLETLRSDLEQNSKEIYQNFTRLIEEDEKVEQKRSCLSQLLTDLERTKHEHDMLNEMIAMSEKQHFDARVRTEEIESAAVERQENAQSNNLCSNALKIPHAPQNNVNQRTETHVADQETLQPMKPKIVKISFEDKTQNSESSESGQGKAQKEPMPVPPGALKSILKNRKYNNDFKKLNLNNEFQNRLEFSPNYGAHNDKLELQKNLNVNGGYVQSQYIYPPPDVTEGINPNYSFTIPLSLYDSFPHEHSQILGQSPLTKLTEDLKTAYPMTNPHPSGMTRTPTNAYPHSTMVTTKALIHNDTDSSTSSDTSGLSSMYSSSPTAEEPFVEQGYVLDTLV